MSASRRVDISETSSRWAVLLARLTWKVGADLGSELRSNRIGVRPCYFQGVDDPDSLAVEAIDAMGRPHNHSSEGFASSTNISGATAFAICSSIGSPVRGNIVTVLPAVNGPEISARSRSVFHSGHLATSDQIPRRPAGQRPSRCCVRSSTPSSLLSLNGVYLEITCARFDSSADGVGAGDRLPSRPAVDLLNADRATMRGPHFDTVSDCRRCHRAAEAGWFPPCGGRVARG
jgi:hypothetical protein